MSKLAAAEKRQKEIIMDKKKNASQHEAKLQKAKENEKLNRKQLEKEAEK